MATCVGTWVHGRRARLVAINGGVAAARAYVTAVSCSQDKLDVFVVGTDNRVYTVAWEPGFTLRAPHRQRVANVAQADCRNRQGSGCDEQSKVLDSVTRLRVLER